MTLTFDWWREDAADPTSIRVTFTPPWSTPAVLGRSPDRCHAGEGEPLVVEGFAAEDAEVLAEFTAEYAAEPDLRELVAMECEREGAAWADSYSDARGWAESREE